jgi:hypothetical protein
MKFDDSPQNRSAVTNDEIAAIYNRAIRAGHSGETDRSQPLPELCPQPALATIFHRPDLTDQPEWLQDRNRFFSLCCETTAGKPAYEPSAAGARVSEDPGSRRRYLNHWARVSPANAGRAKRIAHRKAETENGGLKKRSRRHGPGSFRVMRRGKGGNVGNVESVNCRSDYPGDGTNPSLRLCFGLNRLHRISISLLSKSKGLRRGQCIRSNPLSSHCREQPISLHQLSCNSRQSVLPENVISA